MASLSLDVVSDVVCPWCWLGKRNLDAARAASPDIDVEVTFRPHELDPSVPKEGVPYRAYMDAKLGGDEAARARFKAMREHLEAAAPAAGITFRFDDIELRLNTIDAHRLVRWSRGQGKDGEAKEALFRAYFDELRNISAHGALVEIAADIGLDADIVRELLATDRDVAAVREEAAFFRNLGVTGVPTFIANGALALPGAVEVEAMQRFLREAVDAA